MEQQSALDKILDLLRELTGQIGGTAKELWPHAVSHYQWDAISNVLCGFVIFLVGCIALSKLDRVAEKLEGEQHVWARIAGALVMIICLLISLPMAFGNLADAIEPTGGLLRLILGEL